MNKKTVGLGVLALTIGVISVSAGSVMAYQGDPNVKGPYYSVDRHEAMEKAFENKDYNAWKSLMQGRGKVTQVVNEENFANFAESHEMMEQGKIIEAREVRQELGLGLRDGSGRGIGGMGMGVGRGANR